MIIVGKHNTIHNTTVPIITTVAIIHGDACGPLDGTSQEVITPELPPYLELPLTVIRSLGAGQVC